MLPCESGRPASGAMGAPVPVLPPLPSSGAPPHPVAVIPPPTETETHASQPASHPHIAFVLLTFETFPPGARNGAKGVLLERARASDRHRGQKRAAGPRLRKN